MIQPTQEQIKEFWEWCGCNIASFPFFLNEQETIYDLVFPDHSEQRFHKDLVDSLDLNNLFKYAVPKLPYFGAEMAKIEIMKTLSAIREDGREWHCSIRHYDTKIASQFGKTPAIALFWAIWEIIKRER